MIGAADTVVVATGAMIIAVITGDPQGARLIVAAVIILPAIRLTVLEGIGRGPCRIRLMAAQIEADMDGARTCTPAKFEGSLLILARIR